MKPRLLDLFCGAGGAAMGYHRAGFEVVGIDLHPQPRYPFQFVQGDALEALRGPIPLGFDAIHASPPCQAYSALRTMPNRREHPDLVGPVRELLKATGLPWVIENVFGAPLLNPLKLCGSQFGLQSEGYGLQRHRYLEASFPWPMLLHPCAHLPKTVGVYGAKARDIALEKRHYAQPAEGRGKPVGVVLPQRVGFEAMGIDWMNIEEASEAIPPAYTEWIGHHLLNELGERAA